jgi:hypothetical protein
MIKHLCKHFSKTLQDAWNILSFPVTMFIPDESRKCFVTNFCNSCLLLSSFYIRRFILTFKIFYVKTDIISSTILLHNAAC